MEKVINGIYSYSEWVVDDTEKINKLNALLVTEKDTETRNKIEQEILQEKQKLREIQYSFPISRVKDKCVDCHNSLGETFEQQLKNNVARGNYCPSCNAKYGKLI